ncbi:MAG: hypothetical protein LCH84_04495 [Gemmatimonadetes bacterium]|nr:hypothetical protein [Gemmatimonadota bacterium]
MTDPNSFTAEHRSWEWELVLQFEDGSLPPNQWNEATLGVVAGWYAKNVTPAQARTRYAKAYQRNHRRLTHRLEGATVDTAAIEAVEAVWESILEKRLPVEPPTAE